jgi:hypothetical protein
MSVPTPSASFNLQIPSWEPTSNLTQRLIDKIESIFLIESLNSLIDSYQNYSSRALLVSQTPSDLESQLEMHLQVLSHGNSLLHDYEQLVSRAAICRIIHESPKLRDIVIKDVVRCDRLQRLRLQIPTAVHGKDDINAFWKDFLDRNALLCEIVQCIGPVILLAPGLYELILTAGGAGKSALRSPLQPAVRSRIAQLCLWHSRKSEAFMFHLRKYWTQMFPDTLPYTEPAILKIPQHVSPFVPSIGPCFPSAFKVLHQMISHAISYLSDNTQTDDITWGRFIELDRLSCIREAGASMRYLSKSRLDNNCKPYMAECIFRNILSIRTLFSVIQPSLWVGKGFNLLKTSPCLLLPLSSRICTETLGRTVNISFPSTMQALSQGWTPAGVPPGRLHLVPFLLGLRFTLLHPMQMVQER